MKRFFSFMCMLALASLSCAADVEPRVETVIIGDVRIDYFEEFTIHPITDLDWARRSEYGIPDAAERCGGYFLVYLMREGVLMTQIGVLVEKDGLLRAQMADRSIWIDAPIAPRLLRGIVMVGPRLFMPGDNLLAPSMLRRAILECVSPPKEEDADRHRVRST